MYILEEITPPPKHRSYQCSDRFPWENSRVSSKTMLKIMVEAKWVYITFLAPLDGEVTD